MKLSIAIFAALAISVHAIPVVLRNPFVARGPIMARSAMLSRVSFDSDGRSWVKREVNDEGGVDTIIEREPRPSRDVESGDLLAREPSPGARWS
ncbi:hypothetical protein LTR10_012791 [Elasticomyces elasticus]|uniref:Uncharacterized protein n=1 Tax=Elasticomyces elasticus TaxID=574655 RepID=A0AAN7WDS7_9PEZI|nr:hypothetical protein LTR10_012791 [Elasticomyces elasticus]KAK4978787.1 hypothetical protein LTR42_001287 [Elasticomyces elasticus]KAK5703927.1 hypothetical protein LTR97_002940 [Elasticomyces elasticus]KAK5725865.1 hypothetical protein LTR15_004055 [Elasticomyces elasticus]